MTDFAGIFYWILTESIMTLLKMKGDHCILYYDTIYMVDKKLNLIYKMLYGEGTTYFKSPNLIKRSRLLTNLLDYQMELLSSCCEEFSEIWNEKRKNQTWMLCLN